MNSGKENIINNRLTPSEFVILAAPSIAAGISASVFVDDKLDAIQMLEEASNAYWHGDFIGGDALSAEASSLGHQADLAVVLTLVFAGAAYAANRWVANRFMNRNNNTHATEQPAHKNT